MRFWGNYSQFQMVKMIVKIAKSGILGLFAGRGTFHKACGVRGSRHSMPAVLLLEHIVALVLLISILCNKRPLWHPYFPLISLIGEER